MDTLTNLFDRVLAALLLPATIYGAGGAFIHARRMALRIKRTAFATLTQAQRLVSYKGCFLHSDCHKAWQKYNLEKAFASAQNVVSNHERSKTHVSLLRQRTRKD